MSNITHSEVNIIISIDPGSSKTGIAVINTGKEILERKIVPTKKLENEIKSCISTHNPDIIIMGDGTWSRRVKPRVEKVRGELPFCLVNEKHSTEKARLRYYKENPPKGFWKLIPVTLQAPPEPYDDLAAVIIAEDYIDKRLNENIENME
ncbi:MAG: pre-16S rRNA-processing nuclease YqgF [Vulcanimicrobiota bacterium]